MYWYYIDLFMKGGHSRLSFHKTNSQISSGTTLHTYWGYNGGFNRTIFLPKDTCTSSWWRLHHSVQRHRHHRCTSIGQWGFPKLGSRERFHNSIGCRIRRRSKCSPRRTVRILQPSWRCQSADSHPRPWHWPNQYSSQGRYTHRYRWGPKGAKQGGHMQSRWSGRHHRRLLRSRQCMACCMNCQRFGFLVIRSSSHNSTGRNIPGRSNRSQRRSLHIRRMSYCHLKSMDHWGFEMTLNQWNNPDYGNTAHFGRNAQ